MPETSTTDRQILAYIRERHEEATPTPWMFGPTTGEHDLHGFPIRATVNGHYGWTDNDAKLIVLTRNLLPWLLDLAEAGLPDG